MAQRTDSFQLHKRANQKRDDYSHIEMEKEQNEMCAFL